MGATKKFCVEQVKRLASKPFFLADGAPELAEILLRYAASDDHAKRVVDAAVIRGFGEHGEDRCPGPHDLWVLCRDIPASAVSIREASHNCPYCTGTGWEVVTIRGNEGVRRCRCGGSPPLPDAVKSFEAPANFSEVMELATRDGVR